MRSAGQQAVVDTLGRGAILRATMKHRAALFDLDGTLLDTLEDLADSMNAALVSLGYSAQPLEAHKYFIGDGVTVYAERALPAAAREDPAVVAACVAKMRAEYGTRWHDKTHLYEGIPELLDELAARGVAMAIFSNKPHPAVVDIVGHYFTRWTFTAALGAQPPAPKKPDPTVALEIVRGMGVQPSECIYVGDTNTDMETALGAGMFAIGALWGFRTREELVQSGAHTLVAHPREILALL